MPDGNCWMIDNLKLATSAAISTTDTDIKADADPDFVTVWNSLNSNGQPVQGTSTHDNGACIGSPASHAAGGLTCNGSGSTSATNYPFVSYTDPALPDNPTYLECINKVGINPNSLTGCGYFYNWYTATAGAGNYFTPVSTNLSSSICPAGWTLPTGSATGQFAILNNAMQTGSNTPDTNKNYFANWYPEGPFEGSFTNYYFSGWSGYAHDIANYWSSTANSSYAGDPDALLFYNDDYGVFIEFYNGAGGIPVRCLIK